MVNKKAFTLVELIIVIVILTILGTIAFITLQGYSKDARNSTRGADTAIMRKALELYTLKSYKYPLPDLPQEVIYNSDLVRTQGYFGKKLNKDLGKLISTSPRDPLTLQNYVYSVEYNKKEYEILTVYEGDDFVKNSSKFLTQAEASDGITPKITGTYNKLFVTTKSYLVPTPTIINARLSSTSTGGLELNSTTINDQVVDGHDNIPQIGETVNESTGGLSLPGFEVVNISNGGLSNNKDNILNALENTYSGTSLVNIDEVDYVLSGIDSGDTDKVFDIVVLNNKTSGNTSNSDCEANYTLNNGVCEPDSNNTSITHGTSTQTWDGTSWVTTITSCDKDYYQSGNSCIAVGTGYYSNATDTTRTICTNVIPNNSYYSNSGDGTNNCPFTCNSNYTLNGGVCEADSNIISISHGTTIQTWNGTSWVTTITGCDEDYYQSGSSCVIVSIGEYSTNGSTGKSSCSTKPANSVYTSRGGGSDNCSFSCDTNYTLNGGSCDPVTRTASVTYGAGTETWNGSTWITTITGCDEDYYQSGSSCVIVSIGEYSTNGSTGKSSCSTKPANSVYTSRGGGSDNCSFSCDANYTLNGGSCDPVTRTASVTYGTGTETWNGSSWVKTITGCIADYYQSGSSCIIVSIGEYSTNGLTGKSSCSTKPANSVYTSRGGGSDNCSFSCDGSYIGVNCSTLKFSASGGDMVYDANLGKYWQKNFEGPFAHLRNTAFSHNTYGCSYATTGGKTDWRLPTSTELLSIVPLNTTYFGGDKSLYWTSGRQTVNFYNDNGTLTTPSTSSSAYWRCIHD